MSMSFSDDGYSNFSNTDALIFDGADISGGDPSMISGPNMASSSSSSFMSVNHHHHHQISTSAGCGDDDELIVSTASSRVLNDDEFRAFTSIAASELNLCNFNLNIVGGTVNSEGNVEEVRESRVSKKNEAPLKRARIETPSPLPTFKDRKVKLGDKITTLQQLVSPFGKIDTASVLHDAIDYIKFLHDQVNVLSTPYLKNRSTPQHQQNVDKVKEEDWRSRGLCLVPISSTFPVATETSPNFGGR